MLARKPSANLLPLLRFYCVAQRVSGCPDSRYAGCGEAMLASPWEPLSLYSSLNALSELRIYIGVQRLI